MMSQTAPIAVDTMGGDKGLSVQVEGAIQATKEFGSRVVLVGPEAELRRSLDSFTGNPRYLEIVHASEVITMQDSPTKAVRKKPDSSLCVAYNLVENGKASAILSSGNSGAMMAAGRIICGLLPGIERAAIATLIPVAGDGLPNVVLDSGANVECHAHHLVQFAVMGSVYYECLFADQSKKNNGGKVTKPKIALLSNGEEPSKGTDIIRAAYAVLSEMNQVNFVGFIEGRDVPANVANVIVCDGMVGNVLLKGMEGCVKLFFEQLMHEGKKSMMGKIALRLSKGTYKRVFREKFDYTNYGGAPLLGLRKLAVVLHGSSDSRAVRNAINIADTFNKLDMTDRIANELGQLDELELFHEDTVFLGNIAKSKFYENGTKNKGEKKPAKVSPVVIADEAGEEVESET
jgi:glycerol-3-phosphate acyltransferase PlsX